MEGFSRREVFFWVSGYSVLSPQLQYIQSRSEKQCYYLPSAFRAFSASSQGEIGSAPGKSLLSLQTWLSSRAEHCELKAVVTLVSVTFTGQNARSCCNSTHILFCLCYQRERRWGHILQQLWARTLRTSIDLQHLHSSSSCWWVSTKPPSLIRRNTAYFYSLAWEILFFFQNSTFHWRLLQDAGKQYLVLCRAFKHTLPYGYIPD